MSAAVKGVFECKYDNENFHKNITYFICKMIRLHVCSLSIWVHELILRTIGDCNAV